MLVLAAPKTRSNQVSTSSRSGAWKLGWYIRVMRNPSGMMSSSLSLLMRLPRYRAGDAEVLAEGRACVLPPEQAAPLQHRHHHPDELLERAGQVGGREHEPVAAAGAEPLLHLVRHRGGGAAEARAPQ